MKLASRAVLGLAIAGLAVPAAFATSYTNTVAQMTAYITNQMAVNNIPGLSIALVDDQAVVWARGFGYADRENEVAAGSDTVYHIGSCSKAILGTAYMQLRDQSRVNIETNLTYYMPDYSMLPRFTNSGPVTIRSLLNHHSGLPGDFFNGMVTTYALDDYPAWLIHCLQNDYPFAPVNERAYYCNSGFVLLSDVVRRITGTNFSKALDTMIFIPLGMDASSFLPDKAAISNRLAAAYNPEGVRQPPEFLNALGSGSMYSSANDLTKYIRMILADGQYNGQPIVSSNGIDVMTTPQLTNLPLNVTDDPQGLGWDNVSDYRLRYAGKVFWKDGATYLHSAFLAMSRDLKLGVAVIQNTAGSQCDAIGIQALQWAILDKQGADWRTNSAFVPSFSPVTNWPQTNLNALAGLYVGDSGYNKIVAETGTLTFIKDAYSSDATSYSNLVPRANGWFSLANTQDVQIAFTNLAGHDMAVVHQADGAFEVVSALGEHYVPAPLSTAWSSRTNRVYRLVDLCPADYFWVTGMPQIKTLRFLTKDGALLTSWMFGEYVEDPQDDNLAFQAGVQYRKGGAIQVTITNGFELLQYSSFRFLDEAAIPTLPVNTITNGAIPFANGTQWYWFTGQTGQIYRARITAPNQNYFVRITDREGISISAGTNGPATMSCPSNGTYAIAVSATNVFAFTASLTVAGLHRTRNDFDGDGKADPAAYQDGQLIVAFSGSGYALKGTVVGGAGGIECSADFDGDGKTDPAVYNPTTGILLVQFSARSYAAGGMTNMGGAGCVPVAGDFDGDRKADPATYDATSGVLIAWFSGAGYSPRGVSLGRAGWLDASEDYDGDGLTDPAVMETATGIWEMLLSGNGYSPYGWRTRGRASIVPVVADYDGDGKADFMFYQTSDGLWQCTFSSTGYATIGGIVGFGGPTMPARAGDYDGDGLTDPAVYDPVTRIFYVALSASGYRLAGMSL
ncbi:MAG: serine hydrolase [Kiritimatiellae bacterium]|nr:serine hydrolase [Kiritimatiellia bacterium]